MINEGGKMRQSTAKVARIGLCHTGSGWSTEACYGEPVDSTSRRLTTGDRPRKEASANAEADERPVPSRSTKQLANTQVGT